MDSLNFEDSVRQFLGESAFHAADFFGNNVEMKRLARKCIKIARKKIDLIDTTVDHKEKLMNCVEELDALLKNRKYCVDKDFLVVILRIIGRFLGYDSISGISRYSILYWQTYHDYEMTGKNNENIITIRKQLYKDLRESNMSDEKIALIFNTTEYQIKKLKHNI